MKIKATVVKIVFILVSMAIIASFLLYMTINPISTPEKNKVEIPADKERLFKDVGEITGIKPARNYKNPQSLNQTADYIAKVFEGLECDLEVQSYNIQSLEYKNIICSFGSREAERIIVGAHYDVDGDQPGADDNASGVAGVLELARLVNFQKPTLKYRIDFATYSLEEMPFYGGAEMGSAVHAKSLKEKNVKIKMMFNLEMIGFFSEEANSQQFPLPFLSLFYPTKGNFIAVVGKFWQHKLVKNIKKGILKNSNIETHSINAPSFVPGVDFSDHRNFWEYGYPAVMITDTSFYRNRNYHEQGDTIETLNFDKMTEVVRGVYGAIIDL